MTSNPIARRLAAGAFFTALVLTPAIALGQQPALQVAEQAASDALRADALSKRATRMYGNSRQWSQAAALHRKAAELRSAADPRAVDDLVMAARLLYYLNDLSAARRTMIDAGDRALGIGELVRAANLYVDAAVIARTQNHKGQAAELASRAELLARSTHLSDDDRATILRRIASSQSAVTDPLS